MGVEDRWFTVQSPVEVTAPGSDEPIGTLRAGERYRAFDVDDEWVWVPGPDGSVGVVPVRAAAFDGARDAPQREALGVSATGPAVRVRRSGTAAWLAAGSALLIIGATLEWRIGRGFMADDVQSAAGGLGLAVGVLALLARFGRLRSRLVPGLIATAALAASLEGFRMVDFDVSRVGIGLWLALVGAFAAGLGVALIPDREEGAVEGSAVAAQGRQDRPGSEGGGSTPVTGRTATRPLAALAVLGGGCLVVAGSFMTWDRWYGEGLDGSEASLTLLAGGIAAVAGAVAFLGRHPRWLVVAAWIAVVMTAAVSVTFLSDMGWYFEDVGSGFWLAAVGAGLTTIGLATLGRRLR